MITREPYYQSYVKHIKNDTTGTVIAVYSKMLEPGKEIKYFDVRGDNDRIYYETPANNWQLVGEADE